MKKLFKTVLLILILNCIFYIVHSDAHAKDFSSFYKVTYEFNQIGEGEVYQEISLVNQVGNLYVSQYSLSNVGGKISNIEAYDKVGPLKITTDVKDETTIINLSFNEKVVGKDKVLSFILKYKVSSLAKKEGNLWQISIPKLVNYENVDEFQLLMKVPQSFGKISVVNPTPKSYDSDQKFHFLRFNKEDIVNFGVLATFGQYQTFDFRILYSLDNDSSQTKTEKIAIPPDTNYQTVYYSVLSPEPEDVQVDNDGNWLAVYKVPPKGNLLIEATGKVNIYAQPKKIHIGQTKSSEYLSPSKFWEANNKKIIELSKLLKTPENIYKFVVNSLSYSYENINKNLPRKGALDSLENPDEATCTQFTDLFIALARAAGIPARELEGYAFTDNPKLKEISSTKDLLHSWPEYYDQSLDVWIMVDPTWEKTSGGLDYFKKFDMSHFVFVTHGANEVEPLPAGSYKSKNSQERQVYVSLGKDEDNPTTSLFSLEKVSSPSVYSMKKSNLTLFFRNESGKAFYTNKLLITNPLDIYPKEWYFEVVPPFARFNAELSYLPKEYFKDYSKTLTFQLGDQKISYDIVIKSLALRLAIGLFIILTPIIIILIIFVRKSCQKTAKDVIV